MGAGPKYKCPLCGDIVQSMYRHDYAPCKCGAIAVDGGSDYTRLVGTHIFAAELIEEDK